jgi:zinc protease
MGLRDNGLFYIIASGTQNVSNVDIEKEIQGVLDRLLADGVTTDELELAKQQTRSQILFGRDSSFSIASQLNEAIATGDWKLYSGYLERIGALRVEDLDRVAKTYLQTDRRTVGHFVPTND